MSRASNPFVGRSVAERYSRARPSLHDRAVAEMRQRMPAPDRAIDLACGTGLSTRPLASFARHIVGVDISLDMLSHAQIAQENRFVAGEAERLPFLDGSFDLATIASAIHWFRPEAVSEIARVLAPGSPIVIYDVWFPAEMIGDSGFGSWLEQLSE